MRKLYIIHGWSYNPELWQAAIVELAKYDIEGVVLKVPGCSDGFGQEYHLQDYIDWASENIPDGAVVLGHSNGGRIVLNYLANNPGRAKSAILLDPCGLYDTELNQKVYDIIIKETSSVNEAKTFRNLMYEDINLDFDSIAEHVEVIWGQDDTLLPLEYGERLAGKLQDCNFTVVPGWTHSGYKNPAEFAKLISEIYNKIA